MGKKGLAIRNVLRDLLYPVPPHLRKKQIRVDDDILDSIKGMIESYLLEKTKSTQLEQPGHALEKNLQAHLQGRLEKDRRRIIPWLDRAKPLHGTNVLEIGCGTGCSTVALAEQGAKVTAVDIDEDALAIARKRCQAYGLDVTIITANAIDMSGIYAKNRFDYIIYFASLEHMTIDERLKALRMSWDALPALGLLVVVETPNRLWYQDSHTSILPYYHWLPNELAFYYSRFSQREGFRGLYTDYDASSKIHFLRRGRGVSYHEFDVAIMPVQRLEVVSSLLSFQGFSHTMRLSRTDRQYKAILRRISPDIHPGFMDQHLDIIIRKV